MAEEKTEQPTPRKLEKAREEGQAAKSADAVEFACLSVVLLVLHAGGHYLGNALRGLIDGALDFVRGDHSMTAVMSAVDKLERGALMLMLPIALASVAAAFLALAPQVGFQATTKPVTPKFDKVSPAAGFKRIFSVKSLLDLLKMIVKALVLVLVLWQTIACLLPLVASSLYLPVPAIAKIMWTTLPRLLDVAAVVYLIIGAADYAIQKWQFLRQNRMSKDEVKREHKDREGDPRMKQERRRLAREFATTPPQASMSRANMLVVNPTHYAVAVRYDARVTPLPIVVASGMDDEAAKLRQLALALGVPIVANPPVARALYKVPLNQPVPKELLEVVAAILNWVDSVGAVHSREERVA